MDKYINLWREMVKITLDFIAMPKIKNAFLWGIALYAIALFALICGDIYYADDLNRAISDYGGDYFSRYVNKFILTNALTLGKGTMDMSPLPQILGVILVVASSLILIYLIRGKCDLLGIVASLPLGLSPHFLQNLSYKFDSLTMGFALFFAIVPFLFKENRRIFVAVSVICLILMFMTYQAANGTYIVLSLYFAFSAYFLEGRNFKQSAIFLAICGANLIIASLIFMLFTNSTNYGDAYVSNKMIALNSHFFAGIWANLSAYLTTIFNDLKNTPYIWLVALISVLFVINIAIRTNRPKIATIFATITFLLLGICLSYGLYLVLQKPLFHPRAFYGFNAFIAIISIANISLINRADSHTIHKILHFASIAIAVITAYFLISFANIYGNALKKQDEYLEFRAQLLLSDLSNAIPSNATIAIDIGKIGNAKVTQRFYDKYGFYLVIPQHAKVDDFWFNMKLRHLNAPYNLNNDEICSFIKENFGSKVIFKNANHTIERVKSCYFVTLN